MKNTLLVVLVALTVSFAWLYLNERGRLPQTIEKTVYVEKKIEVPKEIIREVPVEKIVEKEVRVPFEVIKEVPAKIPERYESALRISNKINSASNENYLAGVTSVNLEVYLGNKAKALIDESLLKTKIELGLRRNGIVLDPKSPWQLLCAIKGLGVRTNEGDESLRLMAFVMRFSLNESVIVPRGERQWKIADAAIWINESYGIMSYDTASDKLVKSATDRIDVFANEWLSQNPR